MKTKELNLCEILKGCPCGTRLYSTIYGNVTICVVYSSSNRISVMDTYGNVRHFFGNGKIVTEPSAECCLFPSKDNRDWSTFKPKKERFDPKTLKPFDKVLVRDDDDSSWVAIVFSHIELWEQQIPYNSDTAHLVGTIDEAPEYYKWWE